MDDRILLITNHNVFRVNKDGYILKVKGNGSDFVLWEGVMTIAVKGNFPLTVRNATYTTRIIFQNQDRDEIGYAWLEINHSIENKITETTPVWTSK